MGNLCNLPFGGGDFEELDGGVGREEVGSGGAAGVERWRCVPGHVAFRLRRNSLGWKSFFLNCFCWFKLEHQKK